MPTSNVPPSSAVSHRSDGSHAHRHSHASLWIGTLHGLAGSSHFLAVLPALALPSRDQAAACLLGYGLGTVVSMVGFSVVLGLLSVRAGARSPALFSGLVGAAGVAAIVVGGYWLAS